MVLKAPPTNRRPPLIFMACTFLSGLGIHPEVAPENVLTEARFGLAEPFTLEKNPPK
jgi:hypothetical protein